ncbi:MAG: PrsW family intramembrane metalloprotease [Thermoplasmata archaeon]
MAQLKDMGRIFVLICGMMLIVMGITTVIETSFYGKTASTISSFITLLAVFIIPGTIIVRHVFRKEAEATARQLQQQVQVQQQSQVQVQPQKMYDYASPPYEATGIFKGFYKKRTNDIYAPPSTPTYPEQATRVHPLVGARSTLDIPGVKVLFSIFILAVVLGALCLYKGGVFSFLFPISFVVAFTFPSLMWISYVYHKDIYEPEPRRAILTILAWGMFSVVPALFFEVLIANVIMSRFATILSITVLSIVYGAIFVPIIEEFWKIAGVPAVKKEIDGELDGIIYGITAGMGFAMVENMLYELSFLFDPTTSAAELWTMGSLARGLGSTAIHAVASGLIGYGYARYLYKEPKSITPLISMYIVAVFIHGLWNGSLTTLNALGAEWTSLVFIVAFPILVFLILRQFVTKSVDLDRERYKVPYTAPNPTPQPSPPPPQPQAQQQDAPPPFEFQREI